MINKINKIEKYLIRSNKTEQDLIRSNKVEQDLIRSNKIKQNQIRLNKIKQNLTRSNKIPLQSNKLQMIYAQGNHWLIEGPIVFIHMCGPNHISVNYIINIDPSANITTNLHNGQVNRRAQISSEL